MKILELTTYTAGICGVGARVIQEAQLLTKKGHEVQIFSTNLTKGSEKMATKFDFIGKVKIKRFPAIRLGGESFTYWTFKKEAIKFKPDVIIAHAYRHTHTSHALKIAKAVGSKVFLVTHAPFVPGDSTRSSLSKYVVKFYDYFIGPITLRKFDKVIAITKWEIPFLEKLGLRKEDVEYIPNGISEDFFEHKKSSEKKTILFIGRVSPIKDLETLIKAFHVSKLNNFNLEIVGPAEKRYFSKLKKIIFKEKINNILFSGPIYDRSKLVSKIDSAKIFVLPSKREAMPQALIEAMARGKIVVASDNPGTRDIISHGNNGFLFPVGDFQNLSEILVDLSTKKYAQIQKEARKTAENYKWPKIISSLDKLISSI